MHTLPKTWTILSEINIATLGQQNYARTLYITSCQITVQKVMGKTHHELASWSSLFTRGNKASARLLYRQKAPSQLTVKMRNKCPQWVSLPQETFLQLCMALCRFHSLLSSKRHVHHHFGFVCFNLPWANLSSSYCRLLPGLPSPKVPSFIFASALVTKLHGSRGVCPNSIFPISLIFSMRFCRIQDFSGTSPLN